MTDPTQPNQPEPGEPMSERGELSGRDAAPGGQSQPEGSPQPQPAPAAPLAPPYSAPTFPGAPAAPGYPGGPQYPGSAPYPGAAASAPYPGAAGAPTYPGAGYPGPASNPGRTNPLSVVAIVTGFVAPLVGVITGIVALTQIRRTGERGRGLAITGISVGAALMVLSAIGALLFFAFLTTVESLDDPGSSGAEQDVFGLVVGDCLDEASAEGEEVFSVPVVDCETPHDYEVFGEATIADAAEFPGTDQTFEQADTLCYDLFAPYVGTAWEESALDYTYFSPTEQSWAEGDREVTCLVFDPEAQLTGSVGGSGR